MKQTELSPGFIRALQLIGIALLILFIVGAFLPNQEPHDHRTPIIRSTGVVRALAQGVMVFCVMHDDRFPNTEEWPEGLIELGIIEPELLVSRVEDGNGVSFLYLPSSDKLFEGDYVNRIMIYEDPKHFKEGVVVAFADGRAEVVKHEDFERMLAEQTQDGTEAP